MKKNVAGQRIGAQMVSALDGSAFTGSVTVYVTIDGGTQAVGSVSSGACAHEGNGFHTYAPAQAETNGDHIGWTFIGTDAVPVTVQVYPAFPQTGDNFARIGAPVGASISADIAAVKTQTAAIETDTQDLQSRTPAALVSGRIDASVGAMAANVMTAAAAASDLTTELQSGLATAAALATVDSVVDAIQAVTDKLDDTLEDDGGTWRFTVNALEQAPAGGGGGSTDWTSDERTAIRSILGIPGSGTTPADPSAGILDAIRDSVATRASQSSVDDIPTATENADALLNRDMSAVSDTNSRSPLNALRHIRNKWDTTSVAGHVVVRKEDDTTEAWRAALSTDGSAEPITGSDPT